MLVRSFGCKSRVLSHLQPPAQQSKSILTALATLTIIIVIIIIAFTITITIITFTISHIVIAIAALQSLGIEITTIRTVKAGRRE